MKAYGRKYSKFFSGILIMILMMVMVSSNVFATDLAEGETRGSISINYTYNDEPLDDVYFRVYRIASITGPKDFTTQQKFKDIEIEIDYDQIENAEYLQLLRGNLENQINSIMLEPDMEFVTDELGQYDLDNLELGLYIILADNTVLGHEILLADPILIMVGSYGSPDDKWLYHFDISAKLGVLGEDENPDISVQKVWKNVNSSTLKPKNIEVALYRDGEVYDTVVLNDKNKWTHTWEDMDYFSTWAVVETTELKAYKVDYSRTMYDFVITNTYEGGPGEELPQTSSLALPTLIFSGIGLGCILLGIMMKPKEYKHED